VIRQSKWTRRSLGCVVAGTIVAAAASFASTGTLGRAVLTSTGTVTAGAVANVGHVANTVGAKGITSGDTATWIDSFQNNGTNVASGEIVQSWSAKGQSYKPGSFLVPDGWTRSYSTDGTTFRPTEPSDPATVVAAKASAPFVPASGRPGVAEAVASATTTNFSTGASGSGDSYYPIFHQDKVFAVMHHKELTVSCFSKVTGAPCGVLVSANKILTGVYADGWVDQASGRAYIPGIARTGAIDRVALACVDLELLTDCGVANIDDGVWFSDGNPADDVGGVSEPWTYAGQVFFLYDQASTHALTVGCVQSLTMTPCAGQPFSAGFGSAVASSYEGSKATKAHWSTDSQVPLQATGLVQYTARRAGSAGITISCFDSVRHTSCSGVTAVDVAGIREPFPRLDSSGRFVGLCSRPNDTAPVVCFDLLGRSMSVSAALEAWAFKGNPTVFNVGYTAATTGSRTFTAISSTAPERVACFDWATDASCPNFPALLSTATKMYSVRTDPYAPSCLWQVSDEGTISTRDAYDGTEGCATTRLKVTPSYCDGAAGHVRTWDALRINDLAGGFAGFHLTIRDSTGSIIPGWSDRPFGPSTTSVDLRSIPFAGPSTLLDIEVNFRSLRLSASGAKPTMEVSWNGDPLQACSQTVIPPYCPPTFQAQLVDGVVHTSTATALAGAVADTATERLAFDYFPPSTCAIAAVNLRATINGVHGDAPPGVQVRHNVPFAIAYTVTNTGTLALSSPLLVDDGDPAASTDSLKLTLQSGDTNADRLVSPGETWTFTAPTPTLIGAQMLRPLFTGTPVDGDGFLVTGSPAVSVSDTSYFFVTDPMLTVTGGIYGRHDNGTSCPTANPRFTGPANGPVTYCYVVTNTGNVAITGITVTELPGARFTVLTGSLSRLDPGASSAMYIERINDVDLATTMTAVGTPAVGGPIAGALSTDRQIFKSLPAT
jgi:uncharacterized repeat protein (TIGR01451 family)